MLVKKALTVRKKFFFVCHNSEKKIFYLIEVCAFPRATNNKSDWIAHLWAIANELSLLFEEN